MKTKKDFNETRLDHEQRDELFCDPDFPADKTSLFYHQPPPVQFSWKRPKELCSNPKFVIDDQRLFDILPGNYGQPWFVSAVSVLYQYRGLFFRAVPADQSFGSEFHYAGVFHFRFWWAGEWTEVVIDDRLPCINGQLAFSSSRQSNQFWAPLLEKAYAKLHGSYEALSYTTSGDVFSELSGGGTQTIPMDVPPDLTRIQFVLSTTVIPTAIADQGSSTNSGMNIVSGRNYTIVAIDNIRTGDRGTIALLRLRHPPAVPNYNGPWAGFKSSKWKENPTERLRINVEREAANGCFWVTVGEFNEAFNRLEFVYLDGETCQSESRLKASDRIRSLDTRVIHSSWKKGSTAGGCRNHPDSFHINPQFRISLSDKTRMIVALRQQHNNEPRVIGFSLYHLDPSMKKSSVLPCKFFKETKALLHSTYSNSRQVCEDIELDEGEYVLMGSTYEVGQEGSFTFKLYSINPITFQKLDTEPALLKSPITHAPSELTQYKKQFQSYADQTESINAFQLQELLHTCLPNDYMKSSASLEVCRRVIHAFQKKWSDSSRLEYGPFQDFIVSLKVWQEIFGHYSKTTGSGVIKAEKLREALEDVGFQLSSETLQTILFRYMRRDGTLRFGDFVACILHLISAFNTFQRNDVPQNGEIRMNNTQWMKAVFSC